MKQTTLKNLLIVIFCSLTLHTISPNFLYAEDGKKQVKNGVKIELKGDVAGGKSGLSIAGNYTFVLSDDPSSTFQHLESKIKLNNFVSNKTKTNIEKSIWPNTGAFSWGNCVKTVIKELFNEVSIETNPLLILEDKELILKLGLEEINFGPNNPVLGLYVALDKLPYDIKFGVGFYSDVLGDSYTNFHIPIEFSKKGLVTEEDSLKLNMTIATNGETYYADHNYLAFAQPVLKRFGGLSVGYKTGDKESVLNSVSLSCGSVRMKAAPHAARVANKPVAKLETKINGAPIRDFGFSALYDVLPEKTKEFCGSLDTLNISLTNHFHKKAVAGQNYQHRANIFEHLTLSLTTTFKDICQTKDAKLTIGFNVKVKKPDHESRFSFVVKFSKKFNVI